MKYRILTFSWIAPIGVYILMGCTTVNQEFLKSVEKTSVYIIEDYERLLETAPEYNEWEAEKKANSIRKRTLPCRELEEAIRINKVEVEGEKDE